MHGKLTKLRPIERDDLDLLQKWFLDLEVMYWGGGAYPGLFFSRDQIEERYTEELKNSTKKRFIIETYDGNKIGTIVYKSMNFQLRSAEIGICIGEKEYWGQGYGTDAIKRFLFYLFDQWNLNRIELDTWAGNERAIRTYEKCGFQIEGRLRDGSYVLGEYHDKILMAILKKDFDLIKDTWNYQVI